jgi:haloacetate dehalogenase
MTDPRAWFAGFEAANFHVNGIRLHARTGGRADAPPLLLVHGFPQSHVLWQRVAQRLAPHFRLVLPDLRGYGRSDKPPGGADHAAYSKRTMAADLVALMRALGHERFGVAGHDRGGRVAHRLALDHPQAVTRLAVIDIAPTLDMYERTDMAFARAYYHWFHLIQPAPLPETMILGGAREYLHAKLGGWGAGGLAAIEPEALAEYERCFCTPEAVHGACEDYRASAGIDLDHDRASRAAGQRVACDLLVLWGERGVVHRLFDAPALWRAACAGTVHARSLPAGHFIPEEMPESTADALLGFFGAAATPG